jgi:hypothetical protein
VAPHIPPVRHLDSSRGRVIIGEQSVLVEMESHSRCFPRSKCISNSRTKALSLQVAVHADDVRFSSMRPNLTLPSCLQATMSH